MSGTGLFTLVSGSTISYVAINDVNQYAMVAMVNGAPETQAGTYAVGCFLIRVDSPSFYQNTGTVAIPVWTVNGTGASGYSGYSGTSGTSGYSGKSGFSGTSGTSA